jgi:hypothetical protein
MAFVYKINMRTAITALLFTILAAGVIADPGFEIPSRKFDFGVMPRGSTVAHYFWFKATGTDTVHIRAIKTGCACATMPLERDWLAPADSMLVGIYWDVGKRFGPCSQSPRVFTNAGPDPIYMILKGVSSTAPDSVRPVSIKPYRVELARTPSRNIDSVGFKLTNHSDDDVALKVVSYPVLECDVGLPDTLAAGASVDCFVKLKADYADSEFKRSITVELSDKKKTRFTIPIRRKFY